MRQAAMEGEGALGNTVFTKHLSFTNKPGCTPQNTRMSKVKNVALATYLCHH